MFSLSDWDEWENPEAGGKLLGSSAYQTPGGDGFDPPGTAAARSAAAEAAAAAEAERLAEEARQEEAKMKEVLQGGEQTSEEQVQ